MNSIVYVGMDVHKESYTVCSYSFDTDKVMYQQKLPSDYKLILKYLEQLRKKFSDDTEKQILSKMFCNGFGVFVMHFFLNKAVIVVQPDAQLLLCLKYLLSDENKVLFHCRICWYV